MATVATVLAAVLRAIHTFDHGIWLIAYLLLVGSVAQYLLARGQTALAPNASGRHMKREALLWAIGVVAVPLGVLTDIRLLVALGSVALIGALFLFWQAAKPAIRFAITNRGPALALGYLALLAFMTLSVFVGMALASDVPWA